MKAAILRREQFPTIFFASLVKNLSIPNKEIGEKLSFHSCGSAGWLV